MEFARILKMVFYKILLRYVPMITFPVAFVAGIIGYNVERTISNLEMPSKPSILEEKLKRTDDQKIFYQEPPVLERNLSPTLKKNH
ncbi:small integral membrane protein 12 [Melanaphis sacchari]|uniref:small integral membrane protein 12 n=1 Tax=Melanaphis sacchari TaxID=742174 RepID=UPI000DC1441E|nr:small integral membrane protein 12 [Melanaphis sacchari]